MMDACEKDSIRRTREKANSVKVLMADIYTPKLIARYEVQQPDVGMPFSRTHTHRQPFPIIRYCKTLRTVIQVFKLAFFHSRIQVDAAHKHALRRVHNRKQL